jgi:hypothetical protein
MKSASKTTRSLLALGLLLTASTASQATVIGFGNLGGNNTNIGLGFASNAGADASGFVVANGTTPDIALLWDNNWDVHTSAFFNPLEAQTVGGGAWDNEGSIARIGQLDGGVHTIKFTPSGGFAVVLNSFDFGHTAEAGATATTAWTLSLTDSSLNDVWTQTVSFTGGQTYTISPNFTGIVGESYTLKFNRTASSYGSDGRHGIDNLSFNQTVPEPASAGLLGLAGLVLLKRRRK